VLQGYCQVRALANFLKKGGGGVSSVHVRHAIRHL
jgi:hypothetical protein